MKLVLAGPTGVGKSAVALALAPRLEGEIVSVDSMQVYRGLDLGTAKPTPEERARVPHHLLDLVAPSDPFDGGQFAACAHEVIAGIEGRGHLPVLCGGTGLYFRAILEGIGHAPPADPALRRELQATPLPALLEELARIDPEAYARVDRQNPRRVLTRSRILEEVWGFDFPTSGNALEVYVGYLRRKTEAEGESRLIHTVRGVGYVLRETPP